MPVTELRILLLEDNPTEAELIERVLRKAGLEFVSLRVDSESGFEQSLTEFRPDIVLADYNLPSYSGRAALDYVQLNHPDLPVIMVTGAIGEERAVELLRAGARDYILKDRPARLPTATLRVLNEQKEFIARRESEKKLREAESKYKMLFETANDGIELLDATGFVDCNEKAASMYGLVKESVIGRLPADFAPDYQHDGRLSAEVIAEKMQAVMNGETQHFEWLSRRVDGTLFDVEIGLNRMEFGGAAYALAIVRDITGRKRVEEALRASESRFRLLFENAPMCIHEIGMDGRISSMNKAGLGMMGVAQESEVQGYVYLDAVGAADRARIADLMDRAYVGETSHFEYKSDGTDGRIFKSCFVPIRNQRGGVEKLMGITEDITERKHAEEIIRNLAFFDVLTQLPNRRLLNDRLTQAMLASKRNSQYGALMFLDLDNFKPLNDEHGHDAGDLLLVEVARRISACVREVDTVARFGGDEFVVMLSDLDADKAASVAQAGIVAEKIRSSLAEPYVLTLQHGNEEITIVHHCTSSIGVVLFINHEAGLEELIKWADNAMYMAKNGGRNTIRFFDPPSGLTQAARGKDV
jgi:diguanylate cyclase (GGDEF)-like protein/PAS domain S-box-containing protein